MKDDLERIIAAYVDNAREHGVATMCGDHKAANLRHDRLIGALREIRRFGNAGSEALLALVESQNQSVKCWAATHSLRLDKERSEKALVELSMVKGPIALNAKTVLSEWRKGTLRIP